MLAFSSLSVLIKLWIPAGEASAQGCLIDSETLDQTPKLRAPRKNEWCDQSFQYETGFHALCAITLDGRVIPHVE
jgi:hypothetical protein